MTRPPFIRRARTADAAEAARVLSASIRELCTEDHGGDPARIERWTSGKTMSTVGGWIASGLPRLYVAERDERLIGVGGYLPGGEIVLTCVAPEARFQGISAAILSEMETVLKRRGVVQAHLVSTATARRFFAARGWQETGEQVESFGLPGYPMVKRLVPAVAGQLPPPAGARRS